MSVYYTSLVELVSALVFLIVFKFVMLYAMESFGRSVSEEPERIDVKPAPKQQPFAYRLTKHTLAGYLLVSGLIQVAPAMLAVSLEAESARLSGAFGGHLSAPALWFLHMWNAHKMWTNIWSVVVQLSAAVVFWSFRHIVSVRITATIVGLGSLFLWVTAENFGYIAWPFASTLAGAPGAALLVTIVSGSLVLPLKLWTSNTWAQVLRYTNAAFWFYAAALQAWPQHAFWTGGGYSQLVLAQPAPLSPFLHSVFSWGIQMGITHPVPVTIVLVVIDLFIAIAFLLPTYSVRSLYLAVVVGAVMQTAMWIVFASIGLQGTMVFPLGSWPLLIWMTVCTLVVNREWQTRK